MFEKRAIAFLDVLGFKELISDAERDAAGFSRLVSLKTVIESHVRYDNAGVSPDVPVDMHPKYLFVSDSIILSAPLTRGQYDGLNVIVVKAIQIAQKVVELGHLIRGGISVGPIWHEDRNIFGSGYIEAFFTEEGAVHPRIQLAAGAAEMWKRPERAVPKLCIDDSGSLVVDILHAGYYRTNNSGITMEQYIEPLRVFIENNLSDLPLGSEPRSKWEWMAGFYNCALKRHGLGNKPFETLPIPGGNLE